MNRRQRRAQASKDRKERRKLLKILEHAKKKHFDRAARSRAKLEQILDEGADDYAFG